MIGLTRRMLQGFDSLKARAEWRSVQLLGLGGGLLGFVGDFVQPAFDGHSPLRGPLGWMVLAGLLATAIAWWIYRHRERAASGITPTRHCARVLLASGTVTGVLLLVLVVNVVVNAPRGVAAEVITPVAQLQADLFAEQLESIGYDVTAIKQSVLRQEETLSRVAESMDLSVALARLDRAKQAQDGSRQGQVEAIESLIARGHEYSGANLSGVSFEGAQLAGGIFDMAVLHAVDLSHVKAEGANFSGSGLRFASLEGAEFSGADFSGSYAPLVLANDAKFVGANLSDANFFAADFRGADFRNASLVGAAVVFADLRGARFDGADLTGTYLTGSLLEGASFEGAVIDETDVSGALIDLEAVSASQRAGLCRRGYSGGVEWRVDLLERWPSDKFSTGFEFEQHYTKRGYFKGFSVVDTPLCKTPPDRAVGFHADYPGQAGMHLDRSYLGKAGRRGKFIQRADDRMEMLKQAYDASRP